MSKTEGYLREAIAGEAQANRRYLAYADKAQQEGYTQIARLFRAAAEAEGIHAQNHLRALKAIGSTKENLQEAIRGETHEFKEMYPEMISAAREEGAKDAERSFTYANEVEKIHAALYQGILPRLNTPQEEFSYYVCPICGYTAERVAPERCPVCGTRGELFRKIE